MPTDMPKAGTTDVSVSSSGGTTSAKITGYVIDGIGYCVITAKGVDAIPAVMARWWSSRRDCAA